MFTNGKVWSSGRDHGIETKYSANVAYGYTIVSYTVGGARFVNTKILDEILFAKKYFPKIDTMYV